MAGIAVFRTAALPPRAEKAELVLADARAAACAADGYSRATGEMAIVVTRGPVEALEAASAVPVSWGDHLPLVVLSFVSASERELVRTTYRPICRGVVEMGPGDDIPSTVGKLVQAVAAGTPVQLIASSVAKAQDLIDAVAAMALPPRTPKHPDPADVKAVADALAPLQRPVLLLGREALLDAVPSHYAALADALNAPVLLTACAATLSAWRAFDWPSAKPLIPNPNPVWLLTLWRADGVLALGTSHSEADLFGLHDLKLLRGRVLCCVGREGRHPRGLCAPCVRSDPAAFASALIPRPGSPDLKRKRDRWVRRTERLTRKFRNLSARAARRAQKKRPLDPAHVAHRIEQRARSREVGVRLPEATILLAEGNATGMWIRSFRGLQPIVYPVLMASIGVSLPWSAGVHMGRPQSRIFAVVGDGAFLFQASILRDLKQLQKPVVFFILNDASWNAIRMEQTFVFRNRYIGTALPDVDFQKVAELYGCRGVRVTNSDELEEAITKAMRWHDERAPLVIDVKVAPESIPFSGLCFVAAELDYIARPMRWKVAYSLLVSGLRGKVPQRIVLMSLRMLFTRGPA